MSTLYQSYKTTAVFVSSGARTSGVIENFNYQLVSGGSDLRNVVGWSLIQVIIPRTYYNVTVGVQRFNIIEGPPGFQTTFFFIVPAGFYTTAAQLVTAMQTQINLQATANTYSVTYDPISGILTITRTAGVQPFEVQFPDAFNSVVGFPTLSTGQVLYSGVSPVNINGPNTMFIESRIIASSMPSRTTAVEANSPSPIVVAVPLQTGQTPVLGERIVYANNQNVMQKLIGSNMCCLDFKLRFSNSFSSPDVNLNGENWEIHLVFYQSPE